MKNIIPQSIRPHEARITELPVRIRHIVEYDIRYMQDRVRSDLFIGDHMTGIYAATVVPEFMDPQRVLGTMTLDAERAIVELLASTDLRETVRKQGTRIDILKAQIAILEDHTHRPRWWQVRRLWAARKAARA